MDRKASNDQARAAQVPASESKTFANMTKANNTRGKKSSPRIEVNGLGIKKPHRINAMPKFVNYSNEVRFLEPNMSVNLLIVW